MTGIEGHIFGPMAKTYAYAIAGGLIATLPVTPALSALLLPDRVAGGKPSQFGQYAHAIRHLIAFAIPNRVLTLGCGAAVMVASS